MASWTGAAVDAQFRPTDPRSAVAARTEVARVHAPSRITTRVESGPDWNPTCRPYHVGICNHPLGQNLPPGLETLWLSDVFKQSLKDIVWPTGLTTVGLGKSSQFGSLSQVQWPSSLRPLFLVDEPESGGFGQAPVECKVVGPEMNEGRFDPEDDCYY